MLDPNLRQVYLDALRPPPGYRLDRAVGTTYSLDLMALLVAPVSFALFDCEGSEDALSDPLALMAALRGYAERITMFCQVGQIHVPSRAHLLFPDLEPMVVEVRPPGSGGVFHPKTWFLRYVDDADHVHYRFLCLSRNLTFDRSWDLVFAIEGPLAGGRAARSAGAREMDRRVDPAPLADFLAALPGLAVGRPVDLRVTEAIDLIRFEILRADLRLPPDSPFDAGALRFHPLGIDGYPRWPFGENADRVMIISPFLSDGALDRLTGSGDRLTGSGDRHVLISRPDSIDALTDQTRAHFADLLVLNQAVEDDPAAASGGETVVENETAPAAELRGLHAKLFVAEEGGTAHLWVGSANATAAALLHHGDGPEFGRNVEFLVELAGRANRVGIDALLGSDGRPNSKAFRDLLIPWTASATPPDRETACLDEKLDARLRVAADAIARAGLRLRAEPVAPDAYDLVLVWDAERSAEIVALAARCWPISLPQDRARSLVDAVSDATADAARVAGLRFAGLSTIAITRFMAFELSTEEGQTRRRTAFVLNLPLDGVPEDRSARILQHILSDRSKFLRYLQMLLGEGDEVGRAIDQVIRVRSVDPDPAARAPELPLLEDLVRTLARHPERIGRVKRLVDELRQTDEGREVLPKGFEAVWQPIEATWREGSAT